jgi:hypothetical protein
MIKKGFIFIILVTLSLFTITAISARASTTFSVFDNKTSFQFFWSRSIKPADGSNGSTVSKHDIFIENSYIGYEIEVKTMMSINSVNRQVFQRTNNKNTSTISIYNSQSQIGLVTTYHLNYVNGDLTKMRAYSPTGQLFNPLNYKGKYMSIQLAVSDGILWADFNTMMDILKATPKDYVTINFTMNPIEVNPDNPSQLPNTVGSIFNDSNKVGRVTHTVDGRNVNFKILYNGTVYNLDYTFSATTDMSIFERTYEIYYFTYNNVKYMLFNHGEESMFTRESGDTFIPYTLWNMDTNELATFERYNVYIYLRKEAAMSVTAYFYVDQFIIDNLVSATVSMDYRYINILGVKLSWQPYMKVLENDVLTNAAVSWKMIAASISSAATIIGATSGIGWPLFLLGTAVSGYLQYLTYEEMIQSNWIKLGNTNEIKAVQPGAALLGEINKAYKSMYEDFNPITANQEYKIFKLDMGSFDKFFMDKIEIKNDSFNIASFTYVTNGNLYVQVAEEDYNVIVNPGDLVETPDTNSSFVERLIDFFNTWLTRILIIGGIIAGLFIVIRIDKGTTSISNVAKSPGKIIVLGIIVVVILKVLNII